MINRRLIRIKAFKELYSRITTESFNVREAENELVRACEQTLVLYCLMMLLPCALSKMAEERAETERAKFKPDHKRLRLHSAIASNPLTAIIRGDDKFRNYCESKGISWSSYEQELKSLYDSVLGSELLHQYSDIDNPSEEEALSLFAGLYEEVVEESEVLCDAIEQSCIWWYDDIDYVVNYIKEHISDIVKHKRVIIPNAFNKEDDKEFAVRLVGTTLVNYDDYTELATSFIRSWEMERVVVSDMILIAMGIAELETFQTIPVKVTLNEYVEISKFYSTPKSNIFVNGLLNKIARRLIEEGKIVKSGRGLLGELDNI